MHQRRQKYDYPTGRYVMIKSKSSFSFFLLTLFLFSIILVFSGTSITNTSLKEDPLKAQMIPLKNRQKSEMRVYYGNLTTTSRN